jgi:ferritin-like metal-binding protein YciE
MNFLSTLFSAELALCQSGKRLQLISLPQLAAASNCPILQRLIHSHLQDTKYKLQQLTRVLATCDPAPPARNCTVTHAILNDCHRLARDLKDNPGLNTALATKIQKIEHGEIDVYKCLLDWALHLHNDKASTLLVALINQASQPATSATSTTPITPPVRPNRHATSDRFGHLIRLSS